MLRRSRTSTQTTTSPTRNSQCLKGAGTRVSDLDIGTKEAAATAAEDKAEATAAAEAEEDTRNGPLQVPAQGLEVASRVVRTLDPRYEEPNCRADFATLKSNPSTHEPRSR